MTTKELHLTVMTQTSLAHAELSSNPNPDYNLIHSFLEAATCAAMGLKNRQNGNLPPKDDFTDRQETNVQYEQSR